jgi:SAM-dependent methyltransferase
MRPDPLTHFEAVHAATPDPWGFRTSWYERRKYALTTAALPRPRYRRVWEPGCSIGELTLLLADRADRVDAADVSPTAVAAAHVATAGRSGVTVRQTTLPAPPPGQDYDLLMFSEVLYYLEQDEREHTLELAEQAAAPDADLVVVHWRHHPDDATAAGAAVNDEVRRRPGWTPVARHDDTDFVLDVLTRR